LWIVGWYLYINSFYIRCFVDSGFGKKLMPKMEIVSLHIMLKLVTSLGLNNIHSFDILPSQGVEWEGSIVPHFA